MLRLPCFLTILMIASSALAGGGTGHDHGPADNPATGIPFVDVLQWTETMELFLEYPSFVAGRPSRMEISLTILADHRPIHEGELRLSFRGAQGSSHDYRLSQPAAEGLFTPTIALPQAGAYRLELTFEGPEASSSFLIPDLVVHASEEAVPAGKALASPGEIVFTKAQQWKVPFATAVVTEQEMKSAAWAIGEVMPAPSAYAEIIAPVDGIVHAGGEGTIALPGATVRRGDVVAMISPPLAGDSWAASELALAQAERDLERADRLRAKEALSERAYEEIRNEYLILKAGHEQLAGSGDGGILTLTAPIAGQVMDWQLRPGQRLSAGDKLMAIADPSVVWLKVNVYERDFRALGTPVSAHVNAGGASEGWTIAPSAMRVLSSGGVLDPVTRTIPVLIEVANSDGRLSINETTPIELYSSEGRMATAIPRQAVYEDDGRDVVYVQTGGESFAMRAVELGPAHAGNVSVLAGLSAGERIVTRGGYHVKLASTSAVIGHGHAH